MIVSLDGMFGVVLLVALLIFPFVYLFGFITQKYFNSRDFGRFGNTIINFFSQYITKLLSIFKEKTQRISTNFYLKRVSLFLLYEYRENPYNQLFYKCDELIFSYHILV